MTDCYEFASKKLFTRRLYRQLPAIDLRPMRNVQSAVIASGQHAGCEGLAGVGFGKDSAGTTGRVEDLDSEFAGDVVAADFVNGHAVTFGDLNVRRGFVEFEFAFLVNRQTHRHRGHFGVKDSASVDSKSPRVSTAVIGNGQSSAVVGQRDAVRFADAGINRRDFAVGWVDADDL